MCFIMTKTWNGDAISLTEAFQSGEKSPIEEAQAAFKNIKESSLNAFSYLDEEGAMARADQADVSHRRSASGAVVSSQVVDQ